ncbi:hypothetical protein DFH06DRAFT_1140348 [Mycena polygramma]|nr:hypothetical protein DFH06DRAFT_1140348 [Mycena polygramma]
MVFVAGSAEGDERSMRRVDDSKRSCFEESRVRVSGLARKGKLPLGRLGPRRLFSGRGATGFLGDNEVALLLRAGTDFVGIHRMTTNEVCESLANHAYLQEATQTRTSSFLWIPRGKRDSMGAKYERCPRTDPEWVREFRREGNSRRAARRGGNGKHWRCESGSQGSAEQSLKSSAEGVTQAQMIWTRVGGWNVHEERETRRWTEQSSEGVVEPWEVSAGGSDRSSEDPNKSREVEQLGRVERNGQTELRSDAADL